MNDLRDFFKNPAKYEAETDDLEDRLIYITMVRKAFLVLSLLLFAIVVIFLGVVTLLTLPPDEGGPDVCTVNQCGGRGVCDKKGKCNCIFELFTGDTCEGISIPSIVGVILIVIILGVIAKIAIIRRNLARMLKDAAHQLANPDENECDDQSMTVVPIN